MSDERSENGVGTRFIPCISRKRGIDETWRNAFLVIASHEVAMGNVTSQSSPMGRDKSGPYDSLCELDGEGHCVTCSDEALPARVLRVDQETGLALVEVKDTTEEIDVTLVDDIVPGDLLLVHGGVAIGHVDEANDE
jgi:hydrogenase maturation factor